MLTLPVYRALPCAAGAPLPTWPFVVRETTPVPVPVTPPKPRLLDRVRAALRARSSLQSADRGGLRGVDQALPLLSKLIWFIRVFRG
jgi:hypothetical protein